MNDDQVQVRFDGMTIAQIIEQKIGKALPEAEKVDIKDAKTLGDAIAFLHLVDSIFKEINKEWKRLQDDLTEAGMVLRDKIERYQRSIPAPAPRKGPNAKQSYDSATFREKHPKKPEVKTNLFDDL
jgi:hypothetical protein